MIFDGQIRFYHVWHHYFLHGLCVDGVADALDSITRGFTSFKLAYERLHIKADAAVFSA
ncbi:MAG: hypothetical protein KZQ89_21250 [Candidatus Thiodiazotropha sp. (ex Lucinoma kastoroae)]|nr:hypothetical protein [Candidatus Thiodiazotropha sp. (ex Rostrolucina anterorostrata)]MCU7850456.1 hypothetical protein [Candidatus Thiodiazotropha sp. (ex Lucinoma kastoroae)]MCU7858760.1 hypothetical protein [Candidatus Thiodiazotropha sp. (ex Lucinoma kastoroae)]